MSSRYAVWCLADEDRDLWLPADCDTFDQAADAWLVGIQAGARMEIMERVPLRVADGRMLEPPAEQRVALKRPRLPRKPRGEPMSSRVVGALRSAPDGLSRTQLAAHTGLTKTDASAAAAGLVKRGVVRSEQRPPSEERGRPAPGNSTVAVYFLMGDADA